MPRKKIAEIPSQTLDIAESWAIERPDLDPLDYLFLIYAARLGRVLERFDDRNCRREFGISASDMRVLYALRRGGPPYTRRPTDLFRALLVTSGAITKQVDRLEKVGLVERQPDPKNGGGFLVKLTAAGVAVADDALSSVANRSATAPTHSSLSREEREQLITLCRKVLFDLEREVADDAARSD